MPANQSAPASTVSAEGVSLLLLPPPPPPPPPPPRAAPLPEARPEAPATSKARVLSTVPLADASKAA